MATWLRSVSYAAILNAPTDNAPTEKVRMHGRLRDNSFLPKAVVSSGFFTFISHLFLTEKFTQRLHITLNLMV